MGAAAYLGALLVVGAAIGVAYLAVGDDLPAVFDLPAGQEPGWDDIRPLIIAFVCVWLVAMVVFVGASALVAAACPAVVQEAVLGRPTTIGALWRRSWARVPAVLGTVFLTTAALLIPMVLFFGAFLAMVTVLVADLGDLDGGATASDISFTIPLLLLLAALVILPFGLWIWVRYSLAPAAAVMEGQGPVASMRRSAHLVRGDWWRMFGCLFAAGIMASVVGMLIQQLLSALASAPLSAADFSGEDSAAMVGSLVVLLTVVIIGQLISQAFVSVFPPLVTALLYVDQRIRKENLAPDLARAAGLG
ncbi:oxidoreductase [Streptomyces sp. adm13(2018)]|uniref:DUF7847 domain-containing protein n=1 Tax=Streptomyces sp. adm13(2018) TaxID=2479007 RepID=UPI0021C85E40|nr:oxidoreductase [Streptomyces sp. adm13(2018)]